jgi:long-chain acyl-CoA synthetase
MTFSDFLHRHAGQQPAKDAVNTADGSITYAELDDSVSYIARNLLESGLRRGDRVAIFWSNSVETVQLLLAAFRAGLIAVPINVRLKPPEIAYILEHSGASVCFSEPQLAELARQAQRDGYPEIVSGLPAVTASRSTSLPEMDPDQPAVILYTSGTTARPKGVTHTQRTLLGAVRLITPDPIGPDDILLTITQIAHVSGLAGVLAPLVLGAMTVLLKAFDAAAVLDAIERFGCTYTTALPPMLQSMLEEQVRRPRNLSTMRNIVAGGDTVPIPLQQRVKESFGVNIREVYGMTEAVPITLNPSGTVRAGSIGTEVANDSIRIVDSQGCDVEPGDIGEIVVCSPANCIGYWSDTEATARLFEGGWLHTGDLASRDADGYYWFKGRLKQIIIRGGSNISPQEVEEALYQHPAVLEAGVIGMPDPVYGEVPVAFVALREGDDLTEDELLVHTRQLVADFKTPERIFFIDEIPKGLTGKVDRRRLRDMMIAQCNFFEKPVEAKV